jgi:hypothetical protein
MIVWLLNVLITLVVLGIVFWLAVAVLSALGVTVPPRILQLIGLLVLLIVVLWFFTGQPLLITFPRSP